MDLKEAASVVITHYLNERETLPSDREHFGFILPNGEIHSAQRHPSDIIPRDNHNNPFGHEELAQGMGFDDANHATHTGAVKFTMGDNHLHMFVPDNVMARNHAIDMITNSGRGKKLKVMFRGDTMNSHGSHGFTIKKLRRG